MPSHNFAFMHMLQNMAVRIQSRKSPIPDSYFNRWLHQQNVNTVDLKGPLHERRLTIDMHRPASLCMCRHNRNNNKLAILVPLDMSLYTRRSGERRAVSSKCSRRAKDARLFVLEDDTACTSKSKPFHFYLTLCGIKVATCRRCHVCGEYGDQGCREVEWSTEALAGVVLWRPDMSWRYLASVWGCHRARGN